MGMHRRSKFARGQYVLHNRQDFAGLRSPKLEDYKVIQDAFNYWGKEFEAEYIKSTEPFDTTIILASQQKLWIDPPLDKVEELRAELTTAERNQDLDKISQLAAEQIELSAQRQSMLQRNG